MDRLFSSRKFTEFGPNYLWPTHSPSPLQQIHGQRLPKLRSQARQLCPNRPGVYGMIDCHGELIYVGKAKNLRTRLFSYFRTKSRDARAKRIMARTVSIVWENSHHEFAALHRELELIRRWRPRFNVLGQPDYQRPIYICLGKQPAPYLFLAKRPARDVLAWYGPLSAGPRIKEAVRRLNDLFLLRDCPQTQELMFSDQGALFPIERSPGCLRYEIGTCLGPCVGICTRKKYFEQVQEARAFLDGHREEILDEILREMESSAGQCLFERAAALRDKWTSLAWLHDKLNQMRKLQAEGSFIYPLCGQDGKTTWYLIHAGQTVSALPEPRSPAKRAEAEKMIRKIYQNELVTAPDEIHFRRDSLLLVASWFRRYPEEKNRLLHPQQITALG